MNYDEATKTVTLDPVNKLATSKVYTTKISGVKDGGGSKLVDKVWSFKTKRR